MKTWVLIAVLALGVVGVGCNSYTPKDLGDVPISELGTNPDFSLVQAKIFKPYCVTCHSEGNGGSVNVETYANVKRFLSQIQDSVLVRQTMPPGEPLSQNLQQLLSTWIAAGAPETVSQPNGLAPDAENGQLPAAEDFGG